MHLPGGMSRMISSRLVQSASHSGIGISPASIMFISSLRNVGHQKVLNCSVRHEGVRRPVDRDEHDRVARMPSALVTVSGRKIAALSSSLQQLVLLAVDVGHHAAGAAEVVRDEIIGRYRGRAVGHG